MKTRLNRVLIFVAVAPVLLMAGLGVWTARVDKSRVQSRLEDTALEQLSERRVMLSDILGKIRQDVLGVLRSLEGNTLPHFLREPARQHPLVRQVFVMDAKRLVFPDPESQDLNQRERGFLERTASIWSSGETFYHESEVDHIKSAGWRGRRPLASSAGFGWYTWFWDNGLNFIVWQRTADGVVRGVELERAAVMSAVINALPSSEEQSYRSGSIRESRAGYRTTLMNAQGKLIYQWGRLNAVIGEQPLAVIALDEPLASWRLEHYAPPVNSGPLSVMVMSIILAIVAVALAVVFGVVYIHREQSRLAREASERVTFVNQVSHELKTPLTNIQMYAELLQKRIDESDEKSSHYLGVVTSESQRLGRMINNVLAFARHQRGKLKLQYTCNVVDDVAGSVIDAFGPSFESLEIAVQFERACGSEAMFDRDILEQILGNLLSNVEKYAGRGATVKITTSCAGQQGIILVHDDGPGIPSSCRVDIFEPFIRLDDRLVEGVSGTGIGLSIARELARMHGGDLTLEPSEKGACFKVVVEFGKVKDEE